MLTDGTDDATFANAFRVTALWPPKEGEWQLHDLSQICTHAQFRLLGSSVFFGSRIERLNT